jgi:hypothetical protein
MTQRPPRAGDRGDHMRAIVQDRYGDLDVLELRDIDRPVPRTTRCWCGCRRPASTGATGM